MASLFTRPEPSNPSNLRLASTSVSEQVDSQSQEKLKATPNELDVKCDVLIVGSGPIGATYAQAFCEAGLQVLMVDVGDQDTPNPGTHKKNTVGFQKNIDKFVNVIQGALDKVSIPASDTRLHTLDPLVWKAERSFVRNGMNPEQYPWRNLPGQAVTRTVGGMSTHWTCSVPRFTGEELPLITNDGDEENKKMWAALYDDAERLIRKGEDQFAHSMRHRMVLTALDNAYENRRNFSHLPLACKRISPSSVEWSSASTVFNLQDKGEFGGPGAWFKLQPTHQCFSLEHDSKPDSIKSATIRVFSPDPVIAPQEGEIRPCYTVTAKVYVLAAGAVANPQILAQSDLIPSRNPNDPAPKIFIPHHIPNVGMYITEQTMAFCQTLFYQSIITDAENDPRFEKEIEEHRRRHPLDPLCIPWNDPEMQIISRYDDTPDPNHHDRPIRPWHGQIHRDAFSYGAVADSIDNRLIVDFRWFGRTEPEEQNTIWFSPKYTDSYGMPQPTFDYAVPKHRTSREANRMMSDMIDVATKVGGFLPGSDPQFMVPGLALHLGGTHRQGLDPKDSAVDANSQVRQHKNLFLGGCGNIPTAFAANPTLTAMAYAVKSSKFIIQEFFPNHVKA